MNTTEKRKYMFCCHYAFLGNPEEAAVRAGYPQKTAIADAAECLRDKECLKTISELKYLFTDMDAVKAGLKRLAFGSCRDAAALAFAEELPPPSVIDSLDLFNVAEIKRDKGGGVEIRLADRLKALEKLCELEALIGSRSSAAGLIEALAASAGGENDDT